MGIIGRLGQSIIVMFIGLFIVFLGLIILIGCIKLMSIILESMRGRKAEKPAAPAAPAPAPEPVAVEEEIVENDDEIVAVITAAVLAYAKKTNKTLVVRGIRRSGGWNKASRSEQIARF